MKNLKFISYSKQSIPDPIQTHQSSRTGKGCHNLVELEPRFRRFWKSLGIGSSIIEYMIEKHVFSNLFP